MQSHTNVPPVFLVPDNKGKQIGLFRPSETILYPNYFSPVRTSSHSITLAFAMRIPFHATLLKLTTVLLLHTFVSAQTSLSGPCADIECSPILSTFAACSTPSVRPQALLNCLCSQPVSYESHIQACSSCLVSAGFGVEASSIGSALDICTLPWMNGTQNGTTSTSASESLVPSPTQTQGPIVVSPTVSGGIQVRPLAILCILVQIFVWGWWLCL